MDKTGHFYFSQKQKDLSRTLNISGDNYCIIDGKEYLYSEWRHDDNGSNWDDAVYLGFGEYSRSERTQPTRQIDNPLEGLLLCRQLLNQDAEWPDIIGD